MKSLFRNLWSFRKPKTRNRRGPLRMMFVITSMPVGGAETLLTEMDDEQLLELISLDIDRTKV